MNLHKHQLYLLEQHSESFKIWSAIIRINTESKSSIMKLAQVLLATWVVNILIIIHLISPKRWSLTCIVYCTSIYESNITQFCRHVVYTKGCIQLEQTLV